MSGANKLMTAGGGGVTIQPASSIASDVTVNVPSQNCTLGIQGPAFSAYQDAVQSIANNTYTKLQFNKEAFDTASCFDSSTNYRFTPNVAGYYQFNASTTLVSNVNNLATFGLLYKNGNAILWSQATGTSAAYATTTLSTVIYMNGSTDYVEMYGFQTSGGALNTVALANYMQFSGCLVRAA